jgi:tetratricopeptide (TPR) repeat protein/TolB-like protein
MQNDVFISYSSKDTDTANTILAYLEMKGLKCWIAQRDIRPGANYGEVLMQNLSASKVVVLILSRHSNASQQVMREIERAVNKRITIIPFRIDDVRLSNALEYFISACQWLDARKQIGEEVLDQLYGIIHHMVVNNLSEESINVNTLSNYGGTEGRSKIKKYIVFSMTVILLLVIGGLLGKNYFYSSFPSQSLVIVPFEQLDTAPYSKSNIKEELFERLDRYEPLTVYSVDTLQKDENGQLNVDKTIGSINARFIITGKSRNLGNNIRYTVNILDRSVSPPREIWTTTFEAGFLVKQSKLNAVSRQINQCIMLESSKLKSTLTPSSFDLYRAGQLWFTDDSPNSLQEAEASFRAMIQSDSTLSVAYSSLGLILFYEYQDSRKGELLNEIKTLAQKSLLLDSISTDGYCLLGIVTYEAERDIEKAIQLFKHAVNISPDNIPALAMLGQIYFNKDLKESKYYFLRAKQLDPGIPMNYTNLGGAYYFSGNLNETYTTLIDGLKLDSMDYLTWRTLGCYYERKELFDEALHAFKTALKHGDYDLPARDYIAGIQILRGNLNGADSVLQEGIQSNPQLYQLKYTQGLICQLQKKYSKANSIWRSGLESVKRTNEKERSADEFIYIGLFSGRLGDNQNAIMNGQRAINLDSTNSDILAGMARIYSILGDKTQMIYWLRLAKRYAVDIDEAYLKTMPDFLGYINDTEILDIVRK